MLKRCHLSPSLSLARSLFSVSLLLTSLSCVLAVVRFSDLTSAVILTMKQLINSAVRISIHTRYLFFLVGLVSAGISDANRPINKVLPRRAFAR